MSNREKIIVFCAVLAVIYGIYTFIPPKEPPIKVEKESSSESISSSEGIDEFVAHVRDELKRISSEKETYIITKASEQQVADPFYNMPVQLEASSECDSTLEELKKLIYSGYLETENRVLAMINNIEYEKGEKLPDYDDCAVIADITPNHIVIEIKGGKQEIIELIEEQEQLRSEK